MWFWLEASRAGWGFCQLRVPMGRGVDSLVFGALPGPTQSSPRAELYAFLQALQVCIPPICVHADFRDLADGLALGVRWRCAQRRLSAPMPLGIGGLTSLPGMAEIA
eukprot:3320947-Pyramimonas_sp.AAC.1